MRYASTTLTVFLACACMAAPVCAQQNAPQGPGPGEVADLYLRTFVNRDKKAAYALNDYMRAQLDGKDYVDASFWNRPSRDVQARLAAIDAQAAQLPKEKQQAYKTEAYALEKSQQDYYAAFDLALQIAQCKVLNIRDVSSDPPSARDFLPARTVQQQQIIANRKWEMHVQYRCVMPWPDSSLQPLLQAAKSKPVDVAALTAFSTAYLQQMRNPTRYTAVEGGSTLVRSIKTPVWGTSPREFAGIMVQTAESYVNQPERATQAGATP